MLAKFAEIYFENELTAGTPFTHKGANELTRLGVLTISIPVVTTVTSNITEGTIAGFMRIENAAAMDMYFDNETSIVIGVMFILGRCCAVTVRNCIKLTAIRIYRNCHRRSYFFL